MGATASGERPNVVLIISDDQGWADYGFMGHPTISTPNLDALAAGGVVYDRGYVTAPLCSPSLASIVTGLYPRQTQIRGNDPVGETKKMDPEVRAALRERMYAPMQIHESFVKRLRSNGYATLQTGKWWAGDPRDHGFEQAMTHGDTRRGGRHGDDGLAIGRSTMRPITEFVERAVDDEEPFFIWYGVFLPHSPHNAPERLVAKYRDVAPSEAIAWYWANCEWLDETCGQLLDCLKENGVYDDTLVVYTCDNGWGQDPEVRHKDDGRSKRYPTEMVIRTPIIVSHPAELQPVRDKRALASNIDIAPTILHACGIKPADGMTGLDLRDPDLLRKRDRVFVEAYEHDSDLDHLDDPDHGLLARVVIEGWGKLVDYGSRVELFNLKPDVDGRLDRQQIDAYRGARLAGILQQWLDADRR
ncbi:sulfatase-like hydrolase/transferase [Botrimarina sp.]|uniref:sulfatase-like hydrolase/transferase n=1 Tax=Botrimarina sp. TaxID=2795802 RepID=UPI0032ECCB6A